MPAISFSILHEGAVSISETRLHHNVMNMAAFLNYKHCSGKLLSIVSGHSHGCNSVDGCSSLGDNDWCERR